VKWLNQGSRLAGRFIEDLRLASLDVRDGGGALECIVAGLRKGGMMPVVLQ